MVAAEAAAVVVVAAAEAALEKAEAVAPAGNRRSPARRGSSPSCPRALGQGRRRRLRARLGRLQRRAAAKHIRYLQAKAWVEQARSILEVSEITLREYRDGIYPQDAN